MSGATNCGRDDVLRPVIHASEPTMQAMAVIEAVASALTAFWDQDPEALGVSEWDIQAMAEWLQTMPEPLREQMVQQIAHDRRQYFPHTPLRAFGRLFKGHSA